MYDHWIPLEKEQSWDEVKLPESVENANERANKSIIWRQSTSLNDSTSDSMASMMSGRDVGSAQRRMETTTVAANGIYHATLVPYEDKRIAGVSLLIFLMNRWMVERRWFIYDVFFVHFVVVCL